MALVVLLASVVNWTRLFRAKSRFLYASRRFSSIFANIFWKSFAKAIALGNFWTAQPKFTWAAMCRRFSSTHKFYRWACLKEIYYFRKKIICPRRQFFLVTLWSLKLTMINNWNHKKGSRIKKSSLNYVAFKDRMIKGKNWPRRRYKSLWSSKEGSYRGSNK